MTDIEEQYLPVRLSSLRGNSVITFDLFLKLSDHMLHYLKRGDSFEIDRLKRMKTKGLKQFHIQKQDETAYLDYINAAFLELDSKSVKREDKVQAVTAGLSALAERPQDIVQNEAAYNTSRSQIGKVISFFTSDNNAASSVAAATGISKELHQHCANVTILSLAMAQAFKVTDPNHLLDLGMASMLHDVGHAQTGVDHNLPMDQMTKEQLEKYQSHPNLAKEILVGKKFVSTNVLNLIADHEEYGEGKGYPYKKYIKKLNLLSQILNLCNYFERYCRNQDSTLVNGIDSFLESEHAKHFDHRLVKELTKAVKGTTAGKKA